jgi:hypothetical protein
MKRDAKTEAPTAKVVTVTDPAQIGGVLKRVGGSQSDDWNNRIANDTIEVLWFKNSDENERDRQMKAAITGLIGIAPQDELEGMMAAQLIASHSAAMECYRRAMLGEQSFEGRRENLAQANKLSRTFATLLEALNRHRGKGQQKVTVEHVHVHSGGQAVVGVVEPTGGGIARKRRSSLMHSKSPMHLSPRCGARTRTGSSCRSPAMPNGRCRMHGGPSPGAPNGNKNALKHGRYTAEAIWRCRQLTGLIREMRALINEAE